MPLSSDCYVLPSYHRATSPRCSHTQMSAYSPPSVPECHLLLPPTPPWLAIYWTIPAQWSLAGWTSSTLFWTYFPTLYYVLNFVCSLVLVDLLWWCCQYQKDRLSREVQCFSTVNILYGVVVTVLFNPTLPFGGIRKQYIDLYSLFGQKDLYHDWFCSMLWWHTVQWPWGKMQASGKRASWWKLALPAETGVGRWSSTVSQTDVKAWDVLSCEILVHFVFIMHLSKGFTFCKVQVI